MPDRRTAREREHDGFWAQANLELGRLSLRPWDVLERLRDSDPQLYDRLVAGEEWLCANSDAFLRGEFPDLQLVKAGWRDWLRLFRAALARVGAKVTAHEGPDAQR